MADTDTYIYRDATLFHIDTNTAKPTLASSRARTCSFSFSSSDSDLANTTGGMDPYVTKERKVIIVVGRTTKRQ